MKVETMNTETNPRFNTQEIHRLSVQDAYHVMQSGPEGLDNDEIALRQHTFGKNVITEKKGKSPVLVFLASMSSMMAVLLWIGGVVAIIAEMPQLGIAIFLVNIINGVFSFWQEFRASKATEALKKMLPSYARDRKSVV